MCIRDRTYLGLPSSLISPISVVAASGTLISTALAGAGQGASANTSSIYFGSYAGSGTTGTYNSIFMGYYAGQNAKNSSYANFIGQQAGMNATTAVNSNFIGYNTGNGATGADDSNFMGVSAGFNATNANFSNIFGYFAGSGATNASYSNLFGFQAGYAGIIGSIGSNNIIIGTNISLPAATANAINIGGVLFGTGTYSTTTGNPSINGQTNGKIGINIVSPTEALHISGNTLIHGGITVSAASTSTATYTAAANGGRTGVVGITDGANMYVTSPSGGNLYLGNSTTTYVAGALSVTGVGTIGAAGIVTSSASHRAPIFYDTDNTGYYLDPSATSNLNAVTAAGTITAANFLSPIAQFNTNGSSNDPYGAVSVTNTTVSNWAYFGMTRAGQIGTGIGLTTGNQMWFGASTAGGAASLLSGTAWLTMNSAGATFAAGITASILYDSNNTAYYTDPASTSNLNAIIAAGTITGNNGYTGPATDGVGYGFWTSGPSAYGMYMSSTGNATFGGRMSGETTSDYNIYFSMATGTNRGFVFRSYKGAEIFGINPDGCRASTDIIAYATSDERLKDNITLIEKPLEKLSKINGYMFDWNDKQTSYTGHDIGVIAQEIELVLPEVVTTRDNGYKAVKYEKIVPLLIEAIKEQQQQIDDLKELVNQLIQNNNK